MAPTETQALQQVLAAEQAAVYGYGVVGSHLDTDGRVAATADWTAHQEAADRLTRLLHQRGADPDPAGVAYRLPQPVHTAAEATTLAVRLEDDLASAYLALVALNQPSLRKLGIRQLRQAALRAADWRDRTVAFPGLTAADLNDKSAPRPASGSTGRGRTSGAPGRHGADASQPGPG